VGSAAIVQDFVTGSSRAHDHKNDALIELNGDVELVSDGLAPAEMEFEYRRVSAGKAFSCSGEWRAICRAEDKLLLVTGFHGGPATVALADLPERDGAMGRSLIITRQNAPECSFTTVFFPSRSGSAVKNFRISVTENPFGRSGKLVSLHMEDSIDHVFLADVCGAKGRASAAKALLRTDAEVTVLRLHEDRPIFCAISDGSFVEWKGAPLAQASTKVAHLEITFGCRYPLLHYQSATACSLMLKSPSRFAKVEGFRLAGRLSDGTAIIDLPPK
jgi:hypothetical protein